MQSFHNNNAAFFPLTQSKSGPDPIFWSDLHSGSNTISTKYAIYRI